MAKKLLIRTCKDDGVSWHVPKGLERPPGGAELFFQRLSASGEQLSASGRGLSGRGSTVKLGQMQADRRDGTALQYCPHCGSGRYSESKSRSMPLPVERQLQQLGEAAWLASLPPPAPGVAPRR